MDALTTARLTLRPSTSADARQAARLADDWDVVRHTASWPWPVDPAFTTKQCAQGFGPDGGWIVAHQGDTLVGMVTVKSDGEFGYMIAQEHWGKGFCTEMTQAVIAHVFESGTIRTMKACVFEDNPASARILEKLGFVEGNACTGFCTARQARFPTRTFTLDPAQG